MFFLIRVCACVCVPSTKSDIGRDFSSNLGKRPLAQIGNFFSTISKLGEIKDIEHNKGSKIYPLNQVILDCYTYAKHTT